ncbi:tctex1 domain-containing protein 3 isoform X2 [Rhinatrema bivittatum]|uniref:tctex1 domain-containing protein 3 isoform X2 n=1 Tax=Rhinatrema bivittatum TaxID=194408 RepID=UPI001128B469|nr:tctex1 domain-containing protein 3 isoform X2 [Rhinatrema bivittatum]
MNNRQEADKDAGKEKVSRMKIRRPSMFEVDAFPQLMKERMRGVSHDVVSVEPGILEEGVDDDTTKTESIVWKTSLPKIKLANTYKMEPKKKFFSNLVKTKIEQMLKIFTYNDGNHS